MNKLLKAIFAPPSIDLALLVLRVSIGLSLFLKHGVEKLTGFSQMATHFPDPIHIGPVPSLAFALVSDGICSVLIMLGAGTRLAALIVVINLSVVFSVMHGFNLYDPHGELVYVYLGGFLTLLFAGGGRFSLDAKLQQQAK
jgi:putative oxidoreductase